ncbi:vascular endothelial growth factor C-like [Portunus trituberculatus]|uniref:vascular endothelial growth factor C-like n=1 Tax=Portunus trituberculatus TaxID=210409 RepID=UPI001E1CBA64|nr:vascular endothelial growth factor C-like [Portunus trituberculatus]XP_045102945.1 vascular endothelial growth factor C-like [Portunus trituberculatus]
MLAKTLLFMAVGLAAVTLSQPRRTTLPTTIIPTPKVPPNTIKAEMAHCVPENQAVDLGLRREAGIKYFPTCVRVEQCGGCCSNPLFTCKPISTEMVTYEVTKFTHVEKDVWTPSPFYVNVTKHVECQCQCSVTEQNCTEGQTYDRDNCTCICDNKEQKQACDENDKKLWDSTSCTCYCRKDKECPSEHVFSPDTCECEKVKQ